MNETQVIVHCLEIARAYKSFVHWQIAARISLASLYHDARVKLPIRDKVSKLIEEGKLMDYEHLLN